MIERVEVRNWQSLKKVDLELGGLTVIVGPSSSGKTALMRALRALASNVRGTSFITQGAKKASITAHTTNGIITLEKGETTGTYKINDKVYTKLAGGVPEDVTKALNLQPITTESSSINFAGQFDRPYLLDDSGATVARVLGELTNVSRIFSAVREANRRRTATSSLLKTRKTDLAGLIEQAKGFKDLKSQQAAIAQAETSYEQALDLKTRISRLDEMIFRVETAQSLLSSAVIPEVPSFDPLAEAHSKFVRFKSLAIEWATQEKAYKQANLNIEQASEMEHSAHADLHAKLVELGQCPTCGTEIKCA